MDDSEVLKTTSTTEKDYERIWLQSSKDAGDSLEGRMWCKDKIWPRPDTDDHDPTEYIRLDFAVDVILSMIDWHKQECLSQPSIDIFRVHLAAIRILDRKINVLKRGSPPA